MFDCLAYLLERRQRAVGRDELVAAVWGKVEITDTLLGQTIMKARRAIGDSASEQNAIRTIPRFGYAWVAVPDTEGGSEGSAQPVVAEPAIAEERELGGRRFHVLTRHARWFVLVAVALLASVWLLQRGVKRDAPPSSTIDSAAVLPVELIAPAEWSWVRFGLMELIATRLRAGGQPAIPSDNVVAIARAAGQDDASIRNATGARFLLGSSATWSPSGWSVHLELRGDAEPRNVDTHNPDVLLAGREAVDRLLTMIGKAPPADAGNPRQWSDDKLLASAEAALLTDDLVGARALLESAPAALRTSPEVRLRLAKIAFRAGRFDAAAASLQALLASTREETDPVLRARILDGLGNVAIRQGHVDTAAQYYDESVSLLENRHEPAELGQATMGRGLVAQIRRQADAARADFSRARILFELAGDRLALARVEANEGMLDASLERYADAAPALDRAAQRFERFGTLNELAITTSAEVGVQLALLEPAAALLASDRAWRVRDRLVNAGVRHALSINRASALEANGRRREAEDLLTTVIAEADPELEKNAVATARGVLARSALLSGRFHEATDLALAAVAAPDAADEVRDHLGAALTAIRALRADGRVSEAQNEVDALSRWAESNPASPTALYARLARAEQMAANHQNAAARAEYDSALGHAARAGVPTDIAEVAVSYGNVLIADGELEQASTVIGRATRWADRDFNCALAQARLYAALGQTDAWRSALATVRGLAGDREVPLIVTVLAHSAAAAVQH